MRDDCHFILELLKECPSDKWAEIYVNSCMWFWRKYCLGLIFSTIHGADFFDNILKCLDGTLWLPDNKGEYEENFRKFIKHYQKT